MTGGGASVVALGAYLGLVAVSNLWTAGFSAGPELSSRGWATERSCTARRADGVMASRLALGISGMGLEFSGLEFSFSAVEHRAPATTAVRIRGLLWCSVCM